MTPATCGAAAAQGNQAVTDAGLGHCAALGALRHLELPSCWRLTDAGLRQLTALTGLSHLDLSYCWQARRPAPNSHCFI